MVPEEEQMRAQQQKARAAVRLREAGAVSRSEREQDQRREAEWLAEEVRRENEFYAEAGIDQRQLAALDANQQDLAAAPSEVPTGPRLPVYQTTGGASTPLQQAIAALQDMAATEAEVNAALRVVTKECGLGNAHAVCEAGGIAAVVGALGAFGDIPATAADACLVLGMITQESDAVDKAMASPAVQDGGAVAGIVHALQMHSGVESLQATGSWALWGLVRGSKENAMRATSMGAPETLVAALQAHAESPEVGQSCAGALLAIAANGKWAQDAVARANGPSVVKEMMRRHANISFRGEFDGLRDWLRSCTAGQ
jgi:hypothetical protein